jgi:hypothetical protein
MTMKQAFSAAMAEEGMGLTVTPGDNLEKLVGTGRQGDFVHQGQAMAAQEGFRNVSRLWLDKTMSYTEGMEALESGRATTHDLLVPLKEVQPILHQGGFAVRVGELTLRPTGHAICQLGNIAGTSKWYVEQLLTNPTRPSGDEMFTRDAQDHATLVTVLKNGLRRIDPEKKFFFRTRDDGTLRACLSDQYTAVDNRWFLEVIRDIVPGGRLSHWKGDQDTIFGNILIPDTLRQEEDSDYGGMLSVGNSEIGERRVSSTPSVFRAICMNGCIWDAKVGVGIKQIHRGKIDLDELRAAIRINLEKQIPLLPAGIDRLLSTRELRYRGESMKPLFAQLAREVRFTKKQATGLLEAYNVERTTTPQYARTLFSVVNAVTRAGQLLDNAGWVRFDTIGGDLAAYGQDEWGRLCDRADSLKAREVDDVFATVT